MLILPARPNREPPAAWTLGVIPLAPGVIVSTGYALQPSLQLLIFAKDDADTKRRSDGGGFSATPPNSTCVTPDGMVYHDAAGTRREIRNMTAETYQKVMDLYVKGDLNALNGTIIQAQGWEG